MNRIFSATPDGILAQLASHDEHGTVMFVGHEPALGKLIALLLGAAQGGVSHVRGASLTDVEVLASQKGGGRLEFSVLARMMQRRAFSARTG